MSSFKAGNSAPETGSAKRIEQRLANLTPEKLAALQKRLQKRESAGYSPIPALVDEAVYPLSFHQRRLWFIEQLQPGTPLYNVTRAIRLRGPLNRGALKSALQSLSDRHEALRTTFHTRNGEPVQRINPAPELQLPVVDLRQRGEHGGSKESQLQRELTAEARRIFDLSADPMLRAVLFRLADDEHVLQLTIHHLACDGWSFKVIFGELAVLYEGLCEEGRARELPPIGLRYVDFARWQREPRQGELFEQGVRWWKHQLADAPPVIELATDRPRPNIDSGSGAFHPLEIPSHLLERLQLLGRENDATLFMVLLTGFFILLHRYTGMKEFLVGSATAGRQRPESHGIVGFFVDTVALRANLSGNPTAREVLRQVRKTVVDAVSHSDVPFERIVESLDLPRDLGRHPLVQVLFNAPPQYVLELRELEISPVDVDLQISRFDLEMTYSGGANTNRSTGVAWNTDLFDEDTIHRLLGHYLVLLKGIATDADQHIGKLPLLTEPERHRLLVEWNDTATDYPRERCVHELFEQQVERTPDAVAVVFEDRERTYRELNEPANRLAHYLRRLGVGPDSLVGLCLNRSVELVVAILGILKAGGAYVPLDANFPPQRLGFMLSDAQVLCLVTQRSLSDYLPVTDRPVVCLDADAATIDSQPPSNPPIIGGAKNLAYVMYTSGSTGVPKGVQVPHSAVVNLLVAMARRPGLASEDRLLSVTTPTFDISVLELLLPLMVGGCVEVLSSELISDIAGLAFYLSKSAATVMQATPTTWKTLVESGWDGNHNLKVLCGGETLPDSLAEELPGRCAELWNMYGPTETTIWSTTLRVVEGIFRGSIGRPIANTIVYVLDSQLQPVPIGVPGELYIGGVGLARGYLNRPELTDEKFVADPLGSAPHARMYRTGDRVRWRADGNLEFLGRLDDQVKLRGFRIELGEIEAALDTHPDVTQAVVSLRELNAVDKQLVAYCVPVANTELNVPGLRVYLRRRLPEYMVPAAFVALDALPRTANGKINRRALPAPEDSRAGLDTEYVAPRTAIEQQLASIWCEVLGIEEVGIHDNFFALGGHSLLAMRVNARITPVFEVTLALRKLFEAPTIAELAAEIKDLRGGVPSTGVSALRRVDRKRIDHLPLSFAQQRLWFLEQMEGELTAYNIPFAWRLHGPLDAEALRQSLETIVQRHEALRTRFAVHNGEPVQLVGTLDRFELPVEELNALASTHQDEEIERRCRLEAERPFDLTADLMLRAALLRLAEDEHVLVLTLHHIACDGWSLRVLWRELRLLYGLLYAAHCSGEEAKLADLPLQYADYALWQREALQGRRLEQLLAYWRQQLCGVSALELPTDRPRPPELTYRGARYDFELGAELLESLKALAQGEGATLHMALLGVFQVLLARYSGQEDIAVGTPIAGRSQAELEEQIGFFVNTLVLRTDLSGEPTFRELLGRVRKVSLDAYDHQELPFEKLVEEMQPQRHLNRTPLAQVLFQLLSFSDQDLALPGLAISRLPASSQRVRFDLELHLWQLPKQLRGALIYSTDLFDVATIGRMAGHFLTLLEAIAKDADQRIGELVLLTKPERHRLLVEWNDTAADYSRDRCVHELFEQQVERTPDAVALVFENRELTYRELNARANRLAHFLRRLGMGPDSLVGLCLKRSFDLVVGILGILKAGGAYVPLDADYPRQRLEFMLADARVLCLLTHQSLREHLPTTDCPVVCFDADAAAIDEKPPSNPSAIADADNLAYVMYTSGSTGQPKGVAMPHRALVNLIAWHLREPRLRQPARTLQFAACSFDVSFQEILTTFCCGGTLVLISEAARRDPYLLRQCILESGVERLFMPYVALQQLATAAKGAAAPLRDIVSAGEALLLTPEIRHLLDSLGEGRLHNHYGPTETHVVTTFPLDTQSSTWPDEAPIGRPIGNTRVYVLDAQRHPVPIGVPGELYIGGAGLAREYLNRPELTAERFLANPFEEVPHARLYRTGDRVRWRADGNLEFLGRMDDQVKLRGFRIELGEIETALTEHRSVSQSAVLLREDRPGGKKLVAYCVPAANTELKAAELKAHLRRHLPDYMVPAAFVALDALPLTTSGKINRRALPAPDESAAPSSSVAQPEDLLELHLLKIWKKLFGRDSISCEDNFFDLGGHSLMAVRLAAEVEERFGLRLPIASLFHAPTIQSLAAMWREKRVAAPWMSLVPLQPRGTRPPFYFVHGWGGNVFGFLSLARRLAPSQPVYGLQAVDRYGEDDPHTSVEEMAARYVKEIRSFQPEGPYYLGGYSTGGWIAYEVAQQLTRQGQSVRMLAFFDTNLTCRLGILMNARLLAPRLARRLGLHARRWLTLPKPERKAYLKGRWTALRNLWRRSRQPFPEPHSPTAAVPPPTVGIWRDYYAALVQRYQPAKYAGSLDLFTSEEMKPFVPRLFKHLARGGVRIHPVSGDHLSMMKDEDHLQEIARVFQQVLQSTQIGCTPPQSEALETGVVQQRGVQGHQGQLDISGAASTEGQARRSD